MVERIIIGGGIGAGKSLVSELLADAGFFVIEADRIGHDVLDPAGAVGKAVAQRWPSAVVDGQLSRKALATIVFADTEELKALEAITHPAIRAAIESLVESLGDTSVVVELPVMGMLGDGWTRVAVTAPVELRVARAVARGDDSDDVRARMNHQPTEQEWIDWADHVIDNAGDIEATTTQVTELLEAVMA